MPEAAVVLFDTARREEFAPGEQASAVVVVATPVILPVVAFALALGLALMALLAGLVTRHRALRLRLRLRLRHHLLHLRLLLVRTLGLEFAGVALRLWLTLAGRREARHIGLAARLRHHLRRLAGPADAFVRRTARQRRTRKALAAGFALRRRGRLHRRRIHGASRAVIRPIATFPALAARAGGRPVGRRH